MSIDILMVTYRWPEYARQSLERLLRSCDEDMRVWLWHNGTDQATLDVVRSFLDDPHVAAFHHSSENKRLWEPTNWLWQNATGELLAKVDDDCLVDLDWAAKLRTAHTDEPRFGIVGSWRFYDEDFEPHLAYKKIEEFQGGHRIMRNAWVQGSGYLMKRQCVEELGLLQPEQSFSTYCIEAAMHGYVNGWYFPFIHEEHLDDPRSPLTGLQTDEDLHDRLPLSAQHSGVRNLAEWEMQMRRSAHLLQAANPDARRYRGWRRRMLNARKRLLPHRGEL